MGIMDDLKKRLALNAAKNVKPPVLSPGRRLSDDMLNVAAVIDRDHGPTLPNAAPLVAKQETFADGVEAARDRNSGQSELIEKLKSMVPGQGYWPAPNGTTYHIEAEGRFMMIQPKGGELEAIPLEALNSISDLHTDQMKKLGIPDLMSAASGPKEIVVSEGQRQAEARIAQLHARIAFASEKKTYDFLDKIYSEGLASITPGKQVLPHGVSAEGSKDTMVRAIAQYGRDEGKNMVRELRDQGGEIKQFGVSYSVDGETLTRTHTESLKFEYPAKEIEQAVDTRQAELGAIDRYVHSSPVHELQARLTAEIEQMKEPAVEMATTEETLDALAKLHDTHDQQPRKAEAEYLPAAIEDVDAGEEFKNNLRTEEEYAEAAEQQAEEADRPRPEQVTDEQWEALEKQYAHDLMIDDQPEEQAVITGEKAVEIGRELYQAYADSDGRADFLEHSTVVDGREFSREGVNIKEMAADGTVAIYDGLDVGKGMEDRYQQLFAEYEAAVAAGNVIEQEPQGFTLNPTEEAAQAPEMLETAQDAEAYEAELAADDYEPVENPEHVVEGHTAPEAELSVSPTLDEQAVQQQPSEVEALKAENASLIERLATLEKAQAPQQETKAPEQEQSNVVQFQRQEQAEALQSVSQEAKPAEQTAAIEQQAEKQQVKEQISDRSVSDQIEGRGDWTRVTERRKDARKEAGDEVADKPHVARARASEAAPTKERSPTLEPTM